MAVFLDKTQDKTPFQRLSPAQQAEILEKVEAGDATIRKCLAMLTGAIVSKIKNHGQKLTAHELTELADALQNLADCYSMLNGDKPSNRQQ